MSSTIDAGNPADFADASDAADAADAADATDTADATAAADAAVDASAGAPTVLNPIVLENQDGGTSLSDTTPAFNSSTVVQASGAMPSADAAGTADPTADPSPLPASGATQGSSSDVLGIPLNIWVVSEEPSPITATITVLPTTGTVVLADGTTPVSAGESLSLAQLAGLRFKPGPAAPAGAGSSAAAAPQSSELQWNEGVPGGTMTPMSMTMPTGPVTSTATSAAPNTTATPANPNPIVLENEKPGATDWQIAPGQDSAEIQGFTTSISTPLGGTVQFKINNETGNGNYQIKIYRLGYYGGDGATLVTTLNHSGNPVVQPNPLVDPTTGATDAGNWSVTDSWTVPSNATSGVYIANIVEGDQIFQIPFIVTNPSSTSNIVFQTSDETWQAYNGFGGANLYGGDGPSNSGIDDGAAFAVSYNRPILTRDSIGTFAGPQDSLFGAEYAAIYWLEQNGYDVSYISGIDTATNGSLLLNHKVFMDAGHDEYWTDSQVANVEAAANAGVNLAFLSGNEIFWQTRLAPSVDSSATPDRTLVSYKDTHFDEKVDPSGTATGTFQDPRFGAAPMPSNEVTGTFFQVDQNTDTTAITIPYGETQLRFWRNTSVGATAPGQTASLEPSLLGYEWDDSPDNGFQPVGSVDLSSTTVYEPTAYNTDWGSVDTSGSATNSQVEYRNPQSGALV
ncbi:MAG: hypothetical protein JOY71_27185, partial [Acetobacteraceae bacterium]|nr:hypothetical protein [Acetobacteraceae bacterium]